MKFGKEFAFQMVPEWKEAYMDYEKLKSVVAEIQRFKQRNTQPSITQRRKQSPLYRAFSGLISYKPSSPRTPGKDVENPVILMNSIKRDDDLSESYETMFLMAAEEGGGLELVFFKRLDEEFNKVVKFYKSKVDEMMKEASMLNKQMDAFIAPRIKVKDPEMWVDNSASSSRIKVKDPEMWVDNSASSSSLSATTPSGATSRSSRVCNMDVIEDILSRKEQSDKSSSDEDLDQAEIIHEKPNNTRASRQAPLDLLECTKTYKTTCLNIKGILNVPKEIELQLSRENLKRVEQQLKRAFIQFYHKLRHLKSYSFLNMLAFSKIMKKYDKNTSRNASKHYLKMVDNSYLGSSDEVNKLMDRVEATFINHFSNSNGQKGMDILRPKAKKERHRVTFSLGFFAGCTVALILALVLIIHARNILDQIRGVVF